MIGGIELGEEGRGMLTSFSLLLPLDFTVSSEALEPCYSCIHVFIHSLIYGEKDIMRKGRERESISRRLTTELKAWINQLDLTAVSL